MLEDIRCHLMVRMTENMREITSSKDVICPRIRKKLEKIKSLTKHYNVKPAVGNKYEVSFFDEGYVVDIPCKTCSCRAWELSGLPCFHAIVAM